MAQSGVIRMRLFATWEADRGQASNAVPRLCQMNVIRLKIHKLHEHDFNTLVIALRLQGSKRTLRSNDISLIPGDSSTKDADIDLDISFSVQYPHFVKKKSNVLLLMLQRRKRYKNRPILGFKTLALGSIDLSEVLQHGVERELPLYNGSDEFGRLYITSLSSQPVEIDESRARDNELGISEEEESVTTESDTESDENKLDGVKKPRRNQAVSFATRQGNIKQKFAQLLKKFKQSEDIMSTDVPGVDSTQQDIASILEELELNWPDSDSGPEPDEGTSASISIRSTPKPGLRPYFNSTTSSREKLPFSTQNGSDESKDSADSQGEGEDTDELARVAVQNSRSRKSEMTKFDGSATISGSPKEQLAKKSSREFAENSTKSKEKDSLKPPSASKIMAQTNKETPKGTPSGLPGGLSGVAFAGQRSPFTVVPLCPSVSEQLATLFPGDDHHLTGKLTIVSAVDCPSKLFLSMMQEQEPPCVLITNMIDVKTVFSNLVLRIQRFCNSHNCSPGQSKIVLIGGDKFMNHCVRSFTELFGQKSSEWLHYVRFYVIGSGSCILSRLLAASDSIYNNLVGEIRFKDQWNDISTGDCVEIFKRIRNYLNGAQGTLAVPIAEAMLQCKDGSDKSEVSSQKFLPFLAEVRVGACEAEIESPHMTTPRENQGSPPSSPHMSSPGGTDVVELQIEYWTSGLGTNVPGASTSGSGSSGIPSRNDSIVKRDSAATSVKYTLKTLFRSLTISKSLGVTETSSLSLQFVKEKKQQKVLQKLGMKYKEKSDGEQSRSQLIDNITRLICSTKHPALMKVAVDGVDCPNVKFFQISSQWPTTAKFFQIAVWNVES